MPDLGDLSPLNTWPLLDRFIAYNVEEIVGKHLKQQMKTRAKTRAWTGHATRQHPRQDRRDHLSVAKDQGAASPRAPPQLRDVPAARRRRHHRHRALARARRHPFHAAVPPRRPHHQGTRSRCDPGVRQARPLPAARHASSPSSRACNYADTRATASTD